MAISGINDLTAYYDSLRSKSLAASQNIVDYSQKAVQGETSVTPVQTSTAAPSYRYYEPLPNLTPKPYVSLYTRDDVSAQGMIQDKKADQKLEDFSLSPVSADSSSITDEQMDQFLRKAFRLFDFE